MTDFRLDTGHGFSRAQLDEILHVINFSFEETPLRRNECLFCTPDAPPRRVQQTDLAAELRASGLSPLARKVERFIIPANHVLMVAVGNDVRTFLSEIEPSSAADAEIVARGTSALGLGALGALVGGPR